MLCLTLKFVIVNAQSCLRRNLSMMSAIPACGETISTGTISCVRKWMQSVIEFYCWIHVYFFWGDIAYSLYCQMVEMIVSIFITASHHCAALMFIISHTALTDVPSEHIANESSLAKFVRQQDALKNKTICYRRKTLQKFRTWMQTPSWFSSVMFNPNVAAFTHIVSFSDTSGVFAWLKCWD